MTAMVELASTASSPASAGVPSQANSWARRWGVKGLAVVGIVAVSACGAPGSNGAETTASAVANQRHAVATNEYVPGMGWLAANLTGSLKATVTGDQVCLWVDTGERRVDVTWPKGFSATTSDGQVQLLSPAGRVVATSGDQVALGGGFVDDQSSPCTSMTRLFTVGPISSEGVHTYGPLAATPQSS